MDEVIYDDEFETPVFEEINLNGEEGAWNLLVEPSSDGAEITFQNAQTVTDWIVELITAARVAGIDVQSAVAKAIR